MKKFEHTALWARLHDAETPAAGSAKTDDDAVIEEFAAAVAEYCRYETDLPERTRQLHLERGELAAMHKHLLIRGWLNGLHSLLERAIAILDGELGITARQWEHPECSAMPAAAGNPKSTLHLVPKHRNLGVMGMTELLTALQLLGGVGSSTGKKPTTIAFAETFELAFGFSYNDIYDCQILLFKRQSGNLTKTLDAMKAALTKEHRRRQAEKKAKETKDSGGK
jgi:hypothetical protein